MGGGAAGGAEQEDAQRGAAEWRWPQSGAEEGPLARVQRDACVPAALEYSPQSGERAFPFSFHAMILPSLEPEMIVEPSRLTATTCTLRGRRGRKIHDC